MCVCVCVYMGGWVFYGSAAIKLIFKLSTKLIRHVGFYKRRRDNMLMPKGGGGDTAAGLFA